MRTINFAKRNIKELLRDPVNLVFCLGLPLFLLVIFQQFKIPSVIYSLTYFTPGIVIFSFSFLTLFTAQLVSRDRSTSLLSRLFASPMKAIEYILGYTISLFPIALLQILIFFFTAYLMGLDFTINTLYTMLVSLPMSILFIELGILMGVISSDKTSPALGSLVVQLVAFTSGMWFSVDMVGKVFGVICNILPFSHSLNITQVLLMNNGKSIINDIIIVALYTLFTFIISIILFKNKMQSDNK